MKTGLRHRRAPGSSGATSPTGSWRTASRWWSTTTSPPVSAASWRASRRRRCGTVVEGDILDDDALRAAMAGCDTVFHLAANADVRFGLEDPSRDFEQNTVGTFRVLEAMRAAGATRILFSSSGSVYGEPEVAPDARGLPLPGADLALRRVEARGRGDDPGLLRGIRLQRHDAALRLDHGRALHPRPPLRLLARAAREPGVAPRAGRRPPAQVLSLRRRLHRRRWCCWPRAPMRRARRRPSTSAPTRSRTSTPRSAPSARTSASTRASSTPAARAGWIGDSPLIHLDCSKLRALGWAPELTIAEAVGRTLDWLEANPWVYEAGRRAVSVIFARAPLRLSLGGGGTDLPSYYRRQRRAS